MNFTPNPVNMAMLALAVLFLGHGIRQKARYGKMGPGAHLTGWLLVAACVVLGSLGF